MLDFYSAKETSIPGVTTESFVPETWGILCRETKVCQLELAKRNLKAEGLAQNIFDLKVISSELLNPERGFYMMNTQSRRTK